MLMLEAQMVLPQTVMKVISTEGYTGTVGRIFGKFWNELQREETQKEMAEVKQMQAEAQSGKGNA